MAETLRVEVAFAQADRQWLLIVELPPGASAGMALDASRLVASAGLIEPLDLGVFGRRCAPDTPLRDGDRVEVYRPLNFDPMESRRRRATKATRS